MAANPAGNGIQYNQPMEPKPEVDKVAGDRALYGEQDAWGNSIANLRINLKLTPVERIQKAEQAARSIAELKSALKRTS